VKTKKEESIEEAVKEFSDAKKEYTDFFFS
jgi:hypothetical protein